MFARRDKLSPISRARHFLLPPGGFRRAYAYVWHRAKRISASPHVIALGFAIGAFVSFTPFLGLHFLLAALLAWLLRGSVLASALGTAVGNPLTFPFIWWGTYNVGGWLLGYEHRNEIVIDLPHGLWLNLVHDFGGFWKQFWEVMGPIIVPMMVGALPLGAAVGIIAYLLVRPTVASYQRRRQAALNRRSAANMERQAAE